MCYSALVLAMMFSMGEPLPYHHYGKSSLHLQLGRTAELMVGHLARAGRHREGTFPGGQGAGIWWKAQHKQAKSRVCSLSVEPGGCNTVLRCQISRDSSTNLA